MKAVPPPDAILNTVLFAPAFVVTIPLVPLPIITVPEAIVARQCGMAVAGLSCITNLAAGRGSGSLSHSEVLETGERAQATAARLIEAFVKMYASKNQ